SRPLTSAGLLGKGPPKKGDCETIAFKNYLRKPNLLTIAR
ncbi:MAG: hypothetical protein RIS99_1650, partial [Bacteroidota bacterium]